MSTLFAKLDLKTAAQGAVIPLALIVWWLFALRSGSIGAPLDVSPKQILDRLFSLARNGELWGALSQSLLRNFLGLAWGAVSGLVLGVLIGACSPFRGFVAPTLHGIKHVSLFAWIPLIMTWFGIGEMSRLVFIALAAFFPIVLNTIEGVSSVPRPYIDVARVLGFSRWQLFTRTILPAALPSIFAGFNLALIYSWLATLGSEYLLTSSEGLGTLLVEGKDNLWLDQVLVGILLVGVVGLVLNAISNRIEKHLMRWRTQHP